MNDLSTAERTVLHTLRCVGFTTAERVRSTVGTVREQDVEHALRALAARGLVAHEQGPFGGWGLTSSGKTVDSALIADELRSSGATGRVREAYDRFLPLNSAVLEVCSAWQVRSFDAGIEMNDHSDPVYDAGVLDSLAVVHVDATAVIDLLTDCLSRFGHYGRRLSTALHRARAGDIGHVTDSVDSYHSVWFHLHEDLLSTLGRTRDDEQRDG
jgi:hypothetical protein